MPTKTAQDATGKAAAKLKAEAIAAEEARAKEEQAARAQAIADLDVIEDLTLEPEIEVEPEYEDYTANITMVGSLFSQQPVEVEELEEDEPDLVSASRIIRTNTDINDTVIGHGNYYTFKAGKKYRVPANVAEHLENQGLLWH